MLPHHLRQVSLVMTELLMLCIASTCFANFGPATFFDVGQSPWHISAGDLNGDGHIDLVTANRFSSTASILLGAGDGTFGAPSIRNTGASPTQVALGDLNGDGMLDLAFSDLDANRVRLALSSRRDVYRDVDYATALGPVAVEIGELNGDGKADFAASAIFNAPNVVSVALARSRGSFMKRVDYPAGPTPEDLAIADVNQDGLPDLVVGDFCGTVGVLLGTGNGAFGDRTEFDAGGGGFCGAAIFSVAVADFNNDGRLDVAATNSNGPCRLAILLGNGDGTFASPAFYGTGCGPFSVVAGDLDGDGALDLVVANRDSWTVSVLAGNGDGTFGAATSYSAGPEPGSVVIGDFNSDGRPDLAVADLSATTVAVLLNVGSSMLATEVGQEATRWTEGPAAIGRATGSRSFDRTGRAMGSPPIQTALGLEVSASSDRLNAGAGLTLRVSRPGPLTVRLFDVGGRLVRSVMNQAVGEPGVYHVGLDGRDESGRRLPSGMYFYRVEVAGETAAGRFLIMK